MLSVEVVHDKDHIGGFDNFVTAFPAEWPKQGRTERESEVKKCT